MPRRNFIAKTADAFVLKTLAELLSNILKTGSFNISENGIRLREWDKSRTIMVDLELNDDNFSIFKYRLPEPLYAGLTLNHFHKVIRSIKKKDSIQLFIRSETPSKLSVKKIPKENTRITTSSINIQNIQNIEAELPTGYGKPIIVPSPEFQKMCKDLGTFESPIIRVSIKQSSIEFFADTEDIIDTVVELGETDDPDDSSDEEEREESIRESSFAAEHLYKIAKISGLSTSMQIFPGNAEIPFMIKSPVGSLGKIAIYIKSQELLEKEKTMSSDDEEEQEEEEDPVPPPKTTKKSVSLVTPAKPKKAADKKPVGRPRVK